MSHAEHSRTLHSLVVAVALGLSATACSSNTAQSTPDPASSQVLQRIIDDALANGAEEPQMEVLNAALTAGEMTYEDLASLVPELENCVAVTGATMVVGPPVEALSGVMAPSFSFSVPATEEGENAMELVGDCMIKYYSFASAFYTSQPSSIQAYEDSITRDRDIIIECLASHGIELDADATVDEIIQAVIDDFDSEELIDGWYPCISGEAVVQPR